MKVLLRGEPADFTAVGNLPDGAKVLRASNDEADCVIAFGPKWA